MVRPTPFRLEELEHRLVPALFGIPWSNAQHLTLSFVPDGTQVDGVGSTLFATMNADTGLPPAAWQQQSLKAVEAWAGSANVNVGVVSDSGDPIGTPGAPEGDPRFGDIRISARPLSNVLAISEPPDPLGGTRAGDIVFNSNAIFSVGGGGSTFDLYSVALHEAGHAFGIGDGTDVNSPMYAAYNGVKTGLDANDVTNIQSLYGPRLTDGYEGPAGNNTFATAYNISAFGSFYSFATPVLQGDITTPTDVDYYKVQSLSNNPNGLTFQLNAGMSLLAPSMTVLDASGNVLSTVQSTNPASGLLTVSLPTVAPNAYYYVEVQAANPAFAVGAYQLTVVFNPAAPTLQGMGGVPMGGGLGLPTGDSLGNPTVLITSSGYADSTHYDTLGAVQTAGAAVYYQIQSPVVGQNQQSVLTVSARALDPSVLAPTLQVYDTNQQPVAAQVLANGNGNYIVQIDNAGSGQNYYLAVAGQNGGTGAFEVTADFNTQAIALQQLAAGTLTANSAVNFTSLTVNRSQVIYFALSAGLTPDSSEAGVRLGIFDANGHVVTSLFAKAGQTVTGSVYMGPGEYTVRFEGLTPAGQLTSLGYALQGITLTDPIDPPPDDPSLGGSPIQPGDFNIALDAGIAYLSLALDTLGTVIW